MRGRVCVGLTLPFSAVIVAVSVVSELVVVSALCCSPATTVPLSSQLSPLKSKSKTSYMFRCSSAARVKNKVRKTTVSISVNNDHDEKVPLFLSMPPFLSSVDDRFSDMDGNDEPHRAIANNTSCSDAAGIALSRDRLPAVPTKKPQPSTQEVAATKRRTLSTCPTAADYRSIVVFVATTVLIWLSEPLLSLVDTTIVGNFAASTSAALSGMPSPETIQLAALGPATMLCDNTLYLTYFLAIATTNKMALALATNNTTDQLLTTSHVLGVAALMGTLITIFITLFGKSLLASILGLGGAVVAGVDMTSSVISSAYSYSFIRALVSPLAIMGMTAQSVSLSVLDTKTPALAVVIASVINVLGDVLLVAKFRMGLTGAAIATAVAGGASSLFLLWETKRKMVAWRADLQKEEEEAQHIEQTHDHIGQVISKLNVTVASPANDINNNYNIRGPVPYLSLPNISQLLSLAAVAGPIFFVIFGKLVIYSAMTLCVSTNGMLTLACHNVMLRVFFFFSTFGDGFSQAVQSFLPPLFYAKTKPRNRDYDHDDISQMSSREQFDFTDTTTTNTLPILLTPQQTIRKVKKKEKHQHHYNIMESKILLKRMLILGFIVSITITNFATWTLTCFNTMFTNDGTIQALLTSHTLYVRGTLFLHPTIMILEGCIMATRDLNYLVLNYGISLTVMLCLFKFGSSAVQSLHGIWRTLFLFHAIQLCTFAWRVWSTTLSTTNNNNQ